VKPSQSKFVEARGLRHHCRIWGRDGAPKLFMLHGMHDCSASWQFTVDEMQHDWQVIAPDWRGFGLSDPSGRDGYWSPDFIADLMVLLGAFQPDQPVLLVGHSLGGSVGALFAGTMPERVAKFVSVEGLGPPAAEADEAPGRYRQWLDAMAKHQERAAARAAVRTEVRTGVASAPREPRSEARIAAAMQAFVARIRADNPRLTAERAAFIAQHWARIDDDGRAVRLSDPAHRNMRAVLWRAEEEMACWRKMTAPMLWIEGADSVNVNSLRDKKRGYEERMAAFTSMVRKETIADAGHNVHHDQPQQVARAIEKFLTEG
jgi:pimeloyl-ACP methyl ester carboxylesterase